MHHFSQEACTNDKGERLHPVGGVMALAVNFPSFGLLTREIRIKPERLWMLIILGGPHEKIATKDKQSDERNFRRKLCVFR